MLCAVGCAQGGTISRSSGKSDVDLLMKQAAALPGPVYSPSAAKSHAAVGISDARIKSEWDRIAARSALEAVRALLLLGVRVLLRVTLPACAYVCAGACKLADASGDEPSVSPAQVDHHRHGHAVLHGGRQARL
jgi:hypothetical protein